VILAENKEGVLQEINKDKDRDRLLDYEE